MSGKWRKLLMLRRDNCTSDQVKDETGMVCSMHLTDKK
jgi:hypothetical protein